MLLFLVSSVLKTLQILIFARVIISFFPALQRSSWGRTIVSWTEPMLAPFRGFTARAGGIGLDFSPVIVLLIISLVSRMLRV